MPGGHVAQPLRRGFRRDVPLRRAQHFVTNHEFFYRRRTQQGWLEMRVQVRFESSFQSMEAILDCRIRAIHEDSPQAQFLFAVLFDDTALEGLVRRAPRR
jgi:hypothetical protein